MIDFLHWLIFADMKPAAPVQSEMIVFCMVEVSNES